MNGFKPKKDYETLKEEFEEKVEELQRRCNHPKTEWLTEVWAPGHRTGKAVKKCKVCNKELERIPLEKAFKDGKIEQVTGWEKEITKE